MQKSQGSRFIAGTKQAYPLFEPQQKYPQAFCTPEDIANAVVFLASNNCAGFITGQTLSVDGGYTKM